MDARYSGVSEPIARASLEPHCRAFAGWETIYADWPAEAAPYKYYWKQYDLKLSDYDSSFIEHRDEMAFEMAQAGDARAYSTLQRIVARDGNESNRERAQRLMGKLEAQQSG